MNAKVEPGLQALAEHYDYVSFANPLTEEQIKLFAFSGHTYGLYIPPRLGYCAVYFCVQGEYRILAITHETEPASKVRANIARFSDMLRLYLEKYRLRGVALKFNFSREAAQRDLDNEPEMKTYCEHIEKRLASLGFLKPVSEIAKAKGGKHGELKAILMEIKAEINELRKLIAA